MKHRIRTSIGHVLRILLTGAFFFGHFVRRRRVKPSNPQTILIVRFDLMGDIVNALSAAAAARTRWPNAYIAFMVPEQWTPIVMRCKAVDEAISFDGGALTHWPSVLDLGTWVAAFNTLKRIRSRQFDLAVSIYGPIAGTVVALSGARWKIGYQSEAPRWSFDQNIQGSRFNGGPHEAALAAHLIGNTPPTWSVVQVRTKVGQDTKPSRPLVVLHPGVAHGSAKRWPDRHWIDLAGALKAKVGTLVLVGLGDATPLARQLASENIPVTDLTGQTSLDELIDVLANADVVVSSDSGPGHLARALGQHVVMLHGPTDIAVHGPGAPDSCALRVDLPCGPCYQFNRPAECKYGDVLCMHWLRPDRVTKTVLKLLA